MVGAWHCGTNGRCLDTQKQNSEKWHPINNAKAAQRKIGMRLLAALSIRHAHAANPLTPEAFEEEVTSGLAKVVRIVDAAPKGAGLYVCNGSWATLTQTSAEAFNRPLYCASPVITLPDGETKLSVREAIDKYRAYFVIALKTRHAIVANTCEKAAHVLCKAARVGLSSYDGLLWTKAGARGVHGFAEDFGVAVLLFPHLLESVHAMQLKLNVDGAPTRIPLIQQLLDVCTAHRVPHVLHPARLALGGEIKRNGERAVDFRFTLWSAPPLAPETIVAAVDFEAEVRAGVSRPLLDVFEIGIAAARRDGSGAWRSSTSSARSCATSRSRTSTASASSTRPPTTNSPRRRRPPTSRATCWRSSGTCAASRAAPSSSSCTTALSTARCSIGCSRLPTSSRVPRFDASASPRSSAASTSAVASGSRTSRRRTCRPLSCARTRPARTPPRATRRAARAAADQASSATPRQPNGGRHGDRSVDALQLEYFHAFIRATLDTIGAEKLDQAIGARPRWPTSGRTRG